MALSFDINDMASFDDLGKIQKSAFVLEKGTYKFSLGNSVRNTRLLDYEFTADEDIIVKQSKSLLKPFKLEKRLLADGSYETLPQSEPSYDSGKNNLADAKAPDEAVMFDYVGEKISLDDFIRQFTVDELIDFVGGHQNQPGVCNTGAFGGLKRLDIQVFVSTPKQEHLQRRGRVQRFLPAHGIPSLSRRSVRRAVPS